MCGRGSWRCIFIVLTLLATGTYGRLIQTVQTQAFPSLSTAVQAGINRLRASTNKQVTHAGMHSNAGPESPMGANHAFDADITSSPNVPVDAPAEDSNMSFLEPRFKRFRPPTQADDFWTSTGDEDLWDRGAPLKKIRAKCVFTRHGTSTWDAQKAADPAAMNNENDTPLTMQGVHESILSGHNLKRALMTPNSPIYHRAVRASERALMVSNLQRAQLTGAIQAVEIDPSFGAWNNTFILSSLQENSLGNDAASNLPPKKVRAFTDDVRDLLRSAKDGIPPTDTEHFDNRLMEALEELYLGADPSWNRGENGQLKRMVGLYLNEFPRQAFYVWDKVLVGDESEKLIFIAGHDVWWHSFLTIFGDEKCNKLGDLANGQSIAFDLETTGAILPFSMMTHGLASNCQIIESGAVSNFKQPPAGNATEETIAIS